MSQKSIKLSQTLFVDQELFQFLINNENIITNLLINFQLGQNMNYLSPSGNFDKISYFPMEKYTDGNLDPFAKNVGRVNIKIGRFINKFIPQDILQKYNVTKSDIEKFVNLYKSWFDSSNYILEVVQGDDIKKWYHEKNYFSPNGNQIGTLWNSCMRYGNRIKFLEMYCKNPNIKMLTMLQKSNGDTFVRSRAILWDNVEVMDDFSNNLPNKINVMDRIYSVFDSDINIFKKWANENGYIPKYEQNAKSHQFFDLKGEIIRLRLKFQLGKSKFDSYPYLDTFPFFNWSKKQISNDEYGFSWDYKLVQADGTLERPTNNEDDVNDYDW